MPARPSVGVEQRRARLAIRHRLAPGTKATTVAEAAASVIGLHATDSSSVYLEAWARMAASSPVSIEHELHQERTVMRILAMRRTLFMVPTDDVPLVHAAASRQIGELERRRTIGLLAEVGVGPEPGQALTDLEALGLAIVRERGEVTTAGVTAAEPRLAQRLAYGRGSRWERPVPVATRVLLQLASDGLIGRGRARGTWVSSQYHWSPIERWLPDGIAEIDVDDARVELLRRWLRAFGPGTRRDLAWWTGWSAGVVTKALAAIEAVEVDLDGGTTGYLLADDLGPVETPEPWVALLPALDATTMGWADRDWYLGSHRAALFDSAGNGGPSVWVDGRIVGGWAQRESGEVAVGHLENPGAATKRRIGAAADRLAEWLGPARIRTPFPTPPASTSTDVHGRTAGRRTPSTVERR